MDNENLVPTLPTVRTSQPRSPLGRWLFSGGSLDASHAEHKAYPWYMVLWLTGVDYFSTLGYQPGIALLAAGAISPLATILLVILTLAGALPVYAQVASRSYAGQGSIAMLENVLTGWWSKLFVLALIGFAATDFIITMTLSAADAALHAIENPLLHHYLEGHQMAITMGLLALLAIVFIKGLAEAVGVAAMIAIPYILLNFVVLMRGLIEIFQHPDVLARWQTGLSLKGDWTALLIVSALTFPKLALGLSGFETGVSVMPLVAGGSGKDEHEGQVEDPRLPPVGRIRNTRKLLAAAAFLMSGLLIVSSFVTTLLIREEDYKVGGKAAGRALAFLAHEHLGSLFGTVYDAVTILILWFAGASAMTGLLSLIPRYLPRFGMAPRWTAYRRPLVMALFAIAVIVTWVFDANVEKQGGAYATGVLALILSASIAVSLALRKKPDDPRIGGEPNKMLSNYFWIVSAVFAFTFVDNIIERPDGIIISAIFILIVIVISALSRYQRATELRVAQFHFVDEASKEVWQQIVNKKVNLVLCASPEHRAFKEKDIRKHYNVQGPLAFVHVTFMDNRSEFLAPLTVRVFRENADFVIEVHGAIAIANTIAYISELIDPISIFVGLTRLNLMSQSFKYLLLGEGETGMMIYKILLRYWEWTPEDDVRPMIFLMSE